MSADAAVLLDQMLDELHARCPALCPQIAPSTAIDAAYNTALAALVPPHDLQTFAKLLLEKKKKQKYCAITKTKLDKSTAVFVAIFQLHVRQRWRVLKECAFVAPDVALLMDHVALLETFANKKDVDKLENLANLFCQINEKEQGTTARAVQYLQECLALAHACQILANALTQWQITDAKGEPLAVPLISMLDTYYKVKV